MTVETYFVWSDNPPPIDTVVYGSYSAPFEWRLFKTCKRGCCVTEFPRSFGCMVLPKYWKPSEQVKP